MTTVIVYQGEPGAYSDEAAQALFPGSSTRGLATFQDVFFEIDSSRARAAVLPVENSLAGVVQEVSDLLWQHPHLTAVAEHVSPIQHHLLGREGTPVTRALSHPQALAQCAGWLREHEVTPVSFHDTAGAAREVAERGAPGDGAIASRMAAERYGLVVLAADLADDASNRTRFLVIERSQGSSPALTGAAKFSLGFVAEHRPGGLARVLAVFARNDMNLTRLDSRPIPHQPFHYRFYADVELSDCTQYSSLIRELSQVTSELRPFGIYRADKATA
ncbi:MAG: prephenate dehydratase domain-containing protein [Candidatus Dormiibacterota bacterium]|jgi:prephenate dehydratase